MSIVEEKHEPKTFIMENGVQTEENNHICGRQKLYSFSVFFFHDCFGLFVVSFQNERMQFLFSQKSCAVINDNKKKFGIIYIQFVMRIRAMRISLAKMVTSQTAEKEFFASKTHARTQTDTEMNKSKTAKQ